MAKVENPKRRVKDKYKVDNANKIHKGFAPPRSKSSPCLKCGSVARKMVRSYVLKDGTVEGTVTCLVCFDQKINKHDADICKCDACAFSLGMKVKEAAVKPVSLKDVDFKTMYNILQNGKPLPKELDDIFKKQFSGNKDVLKAFVDLNV